MISDIEDYIFKNNVSLTPLYHMEKSNDLEYIWNNYSPPMYNNHKDKISFVFTPRAACSRTVKLFLHSVDLLEIAESKITEIIHEYRHIMNECIKHTDIELLKNENYRVIKFTINPFLRAVASFKVMVKCKKPQYEVLNITFRQFITKLQNKDFEGFSDDNIYHCCSQYKLNEEKYVTEIFKIDKNNTINIKKDGKDEVVHFDTLKSQHESKGDLFDNKNNIDVTNISLKKFIDNNYFPDYKSFYNDEEIVKMVIEIYKNDFIKYNYSTLISDM